MVQLARTLEGRYTSKRVSEPRMEMERKWEPSLMAVCITEAFLHSGLTTPSSFGVPRNTSLRHVHLVLTIRLLPLSIDPIHRHRHRQRRCPLPLLQLPKDNRLLVRKQPSLYSRQNHVHKGRRCNQGTQRFKHPHGQYFDAMVLWRLW